ncbi:ATP-binding protein [Novipirellula artificiosorum]|uniref:histidine kinase n=1 Tax=Novipirellula artificiosorum TaxID=2528016 RepID=A0A5C6CYR8_9BACT|nr:ATP-binding protein [Novipirellula artificiosorum]TWU28744.1 Sensor protein ZraS [Novipirellula artificiosorum]
MKRSGLLVAGLIILAWFVFGVWQWREYLHQRALIRSSLSQQAESILDCLVSSVQSHRWIGPYFQSQLPGTLEEIAASRSVLAVAIDAKALDDLDASADDHFSAGELGLLSLPGVSESGWREEGYFAIRPFKLSLQPPSAGSGLGGMRGGGPGLGRRSNPSSQSAPSGATHFTAKLVLDRQFADSQIQHEASNRMMLVMFGGLLIVATGMTWRSTVRLADAQGRAGVLRVEARHLSELGQAAAGLAHETRNPLGLVRGWAQRLSDQGLPTPEQKQQADAIVEECDRVTARINEFLSFARPVDPQMAAVAIRELVEQLTVLLEVDLAAKNVKLAWQSIPGDLRIMADAELLRQAIFNLIQNAVTFASDGGCVTIKTIQSSPRQWCLQVADNGPGVDPDVVDSLFEPYFTTRTSGTGLGLAIVQRIAIAHRWSVRYEPNPVGGAMFLIAQMRAA